MLLNNCYFYAKERLRSLDPCDSSCVSIIRFSSDLSRINSNRLVWEIRRSRMWDCCGTPTQRLLRQLRQGRKRLQILCPCHTRAPSPLLHVVFRSEQGFRAVGVIQQTQRSAWPSHLLVKPTDRFAKQHNAQSQQGPRASRGNGKGGKHGKGGRERDSCHGHHSSLLSLVILLLLSEEVRTGG